MASTDLHERDPLDARPAVIRDGETIFVRGKRCPVGHTTLMPRERCDRCGQELETARLSPLGTVWSSTVVRIPIPDREPPFGLVYVDLDDGGRLVAHVRPEPGAEPAPLPVGERVAITGTTSAGDVEVAPC